MANVDMIAHETAWAIVENDQLTGIAATASPIPAAMGSGIFVHIIVKTAYHSMLNRIKQVGTGFVHLTRAHISN
jgi:hypothetical protein